MSEELPKITKRQLLREWKKLSADKKEAAYDRQVAAVRKNVTDQILTKYHPEWTYEQAVECCTDPESEIWDAECSMWWKIAPYFPAMGTMSDKKKVREIAELNEAELEAYDKKIMPLHLIAMREAAIPGAVKKALLG